LVESGIEEICLIIRPGEEQVYNKLFEPLADDQLNKFPSQMSRYNEKIMDIGNKIKFAYQSDILGFGHAVLQSEEFANEEPVLLMLGDHLFKTNNEKSCITQLIEKYEQTEALTIGVYEVLDSDVQNYGIVKFNDNGSSLLSVSEKPSQSFALSELAYKGKCYGVFMYVLTPKVYSTLSTQFSNHYDNKQELQLTPALDDVAKKFGAFGVIIDGIRYDIGMPEQYRRTVAKY